MYKKKPTKSFFDSCGNDPKYNNRTFLQRDKENVPKAVVEPDGVRTAKVSDGTMSKLKSFAMAKDAEPRPLRPQTPRKGLPLIRSSQQEEHHHEPASSQIEERVRWKISPPPRNPHGGSAQKLTINEMFDIYQASQHSAQTPVRRLDPEGDLWSRYDSAEPLPYLDLELSPAHDQLPKTDTRLRRTASLPTWSVEQRERKRRKIGGLEVPQQSQGRVRGIMERMQNALMKVDCPVTNSEVAKDTNDPVHTTACPHASQSQSSEDFGEDELDEALLLALPELQDLAPKRSVSNPLPRTATDCAISELAMHLGGVVGTAKLPTTNDLPSVSDTVKLVGDEHHALHLPASPGASSNYSLDLVEEDFLAASQLNLPNAQAPEQVSKLENTTSPKITQAQTSNTRHLTPAELLEGLDEDSFSDYEE